ncbi:hypothetical protein ACLKA7_004481 [Drosophila subpalustris]
MTAGIQIKKPRNKKRATCDMRHATYDPDEAGNKLKAIKGIKLCVINDATATPTETLEETPPHAFIKLDFFLSASTPLDEGFCDEDKDKEKEEDYALERTVIPH